MGLSSISTFLICKQIAVHYIFHLFWNWVHLQYSLKYRSSFKYPKMYDVFHFIRYWDYLPFKKKWGPLPFANKLRSFSNTCDLTWSTFTEKCWQINSFFSFFKSPEILEESRKIMNFELKIKNKFILVKNFPCSFRWIKKTINFEIF